MEVKVRSMLDGISVWGRELYRPVTERSPTIIAHETARALRMVKSLDADVSAGSFGSVEGPLSLAQLLFACALNTREDRLLGFQWRRGNSALGAWVDHFAERASLQETIPPPHPSEQICPFPSS